MQTMIPLRPASAVLRVPLRRHGFRRIVALGATTAVLAAACGSSDDDHAVDSPAAVTTADPSVTGAPTTDATTTIQTTTIPATTAAPTTKAPPATEPEGSADGLSIFTERGPHPVGVTTRELPSGSAVEIWYPAVEGSAGTDTYDVRDFTPPAIRELLTGDSDATFTVDAARDAMVAEGSFPIVLFSHGFTGMRLQSSFLTSHLASYGMVVVAPDHPSRDLTNVLGGTASGDRAESVQDLLGALDLIVAESQQPDGLFAGAVDAERVAALGHSAGGATVLAASSDPRIRGYVSMASGGPELTEEYPPVPSFFLAGETDAVVTPTDRTRPAFESAPTPSWYWEIAATGHNGFDDFCTFGDGRGIIGVAEAAGLGAFLDAQPQLRLLGEDGCVAPAAPVEQAFPIVRHGVTAWLRWLLEIDESLNGFDPRVTGEFELALTAEARP